MSERVAAEVFLSYSSDDAHRVDAVHDALRALNFNVWRDKTHIVAGDSFVEEIDKALTHCRHVVLFWSCSAAGAKWVKREWQTALETDRRLIPVLLDATPLPKLLKPLKYVDARNERNPAEVADEIAKGVGTAALARADQAPFGAYPDQLSAKLKAVEQMITNLNPVLVNLRNARNSAWAAAGALPLFSLLVGGISPFSAVFGAAMFGVMLVVGVTNGKRLSERKTEMGRLHGIRNGLEAYCPHEPPCKKFDQALSDLLLAAIRTQAPT